MSQFDENNYKGLTAANIPASVTYSGTTYSVTSIGKSAFKGCSSLTSVVLPNSVTTIGDWAFYGCSQLLSVTFGTAMVSIGETIFYHSNKLTDLICLAETPPAKTTCLMLNSLIALTALWITIPTATSWKLVHMSAIFIFSPFCSRL